MKMWIVTVYARILIRGASSLKDRRQVVQSILAKIRKHYNASAADLGPTDVWDRADIASVCVGSSRQEIEDRAESIKELVYKMDQSGDFELIGADVEVFEYGDVQDRQAE